MALQVISSGPAQSGSSTASQASTAQQTGSAPPAGSVVTRAATSQARFETPILSDTGDNYNNWAWTMKLLLGNRGLLSIIDGKTPAPNATADPNTYNDWYQRDQEALLQIIMALKSEGQNCVNGVKSSKECWDRLAELYEGKGDQQIIYLMETLFIMPLTDLDPMQPQLVALTQTAQQLVTAGLPARLTFTPFLRHALHRPIQHQTDENHQQGYNNSNPCRRTPACQGCQGGRNCVLCQRQGKGQTWETT